jgi:hypothetical protein
MPDIQIPLPFIDSARDLPAIAERLHPAPLEVESDQSGQIVCPHCHTSTDADETVLHDDIPHCRDCVIECEHCGRTTTDGDEFHTTTIRSHYTSRSFTETRCDDCSWECADCNDHFATDSAHYDNAAGERICESCVDNYSTCENCNDVIANDDAYLDDAGNTLCRSCHDDAADEEADEEDEPRAIRNYGYKPEAEFFRASNEPVRSRSITTFFGIELEVDEGGCESDNVESAGLHEHDLYYCKEDGSLDSGFEIVSHPATWEYWKQHADFGWAAKLKKMGYRSYDTSTCGMHIHVGRSSLSRLDILKLLAFFRDNAAFIKRMSRRKGDTLNRWSKIDGQGTGGLCKKVKSGNSHDDRYTAINLENPRTIEFRIFRGTLDVQSIKRNIALVAALVQFVKRNGIGQMTLGNFRRWMKVEGANLIGRPESHDLLKWIGNPTEIDHD